MKSKIKIDKGVRLVYNEGNTFFRDDEGIVSYKKNRIIKEQTL